LFLNYDKLRANNLTLLLIYLALFQFIDIYPYPQNYFQQPFLIQNYNNIVFKYTFSIIFIIIFIYFFEIKQ